MSIDDAAGFVVNYLQNPPEDVNWGGVSRAEAERRALGVHTRYCNDVAPRLTYEAVELPLQNLSVDFPENGITINLTGTLDRIYTRLNDDKSRGILDIKTGARACTTAPGKHKAQLATYELLAEQTTGEPITGPGLIGALQTSSDYKVAVHAVEHPRLALLGTDEQPGILQHLARMFASGDFIGNPSSWLCSEKYCPLWKTCIFR